MHRGNVIRMSLLTSLRFCLLHKRVTHFIFILVQGRERKPWCFFSADDSNEIFYDIIINLIPHAGLEARLEKKLCPG